MIDRIRSFGGTRFIVLVWTVAACSSGSPVDVDDPVPTYGPCSQTPNYTNEVQLNRWRSFPLAYFFDAASFPPEFLEDYRIAITAGIMRWDQATDNQLGAVVEVEELGGAADFLITYSEFAPSNATARTLHSTGTPFLSGGEIAYNSLAMAEVEEMVRNGFSRDAFRRGLSGIAAHEMGHLLGIIGHPSRNDVLMGLSFHDAPTVADVNTLIHAYCR